MDVMFYEIFAEEKKALRLFLPTHVRAGFTEKTIQESGDVHPPAALISIRTQSVLPIEWAGQLEGILTRSTGYDHLAEYVRQTQRPILVGHLPPYCSRAVAEHAVLVCLALLKKFRAQLHNFDRFDRNGLTGSEAMEKNMLVIGVGHIGTQIVDLARGLRMNIRGVDLKQTLVDLEYVSLDDGLSWADVIVCALPLTPLTNGWLNYSVLRTVKPGTIFVNVSRGEISPLPDLKRLLNEGILGGLGLDVYQNEKRLAEYLHGNPDAASATTQIVLELKDRDDVVFTPHNAFNSQQALERKAEQTIESVCLFLEKKTFPYPIPDESV